MKAAPRAAVLKVGMAGVERTPAIPVLRVALFA
jgi:hypothetical protein